MYQQCDMLIITGIAVFSHQVNSTPPIQKEVGSFQLQLLIKDLYARVVQLVTKEEQVMSK